MYVGWMQDRNLNHSVALPTTKMKIQDDGKGLWSPVYHLSEEKKKVNKLKKAILRHNNWGEIIHICKPNKHHRWEGEMMQRKYMECRVCHNPHQNCDLCCCKLQRGRFWECQMSFGSKHPNWVTRMSLSLILWMHSTLSDSKIFKCL